MWESQVAAERVVLWAAIATLAMVAAVLVALLAAFIATANGDTDDRPATGSALVAVAP